jgi:hypothetical protein
MSHIIYTPRHSILLSQVYFLTRAYPKMVLANKQHVLHEHRFRGLANDLMTSVSSQPSGTPLPEGFSNYSILEPIMMP